MSQLSDFYLRTATDPRRGILFARYPPPAVRHADCYRVATKHSYLLKKVHAWGRLASLCLLEICK